ncbi:very short patch repair endonuclease [Chitinilyticum aquatile]|uniref:very short patch repair endonuclease n=1 Tax=Chitinilyticum aquatile TaxID=362520 RepID=UPI0004021847|nr:DNA mismatch endonuclease Vsr [Chitinilyticum aquatile]
MADIVDKATRSRMMSGIRSKDTKPEMLIRKALHARGFRFRLHVKDLPGKPDLVLPKYKAVIFINGCFWHGHDCRYFRLPQTRTEFWRAKIEANRKRDQARLAELQQGGWRILVVWECATRKIASESGQIALIDWIGEWLIMGVSNFQINESGAQPIPCSTTS